MEKTEKGVCFAGAGDIRLDDPFWGPKFRVWDEVTVTDVLDKFSGLHTGDPGANDAFANFDKVASGHRGTKDHFGEPWFDGLVYETVRGAADYLVLFPDEDLESRLDGIISRIAAAQDAVAASDPVKAGYLETYTILDEPGHEWGLNGGFLRWQHEVYNAGMLIEAGVHYYKATGKTALLETAVRFANLMCRVMGENPKMNIVPSHSGPEEAMVKLYRLFRDEPGLKRKAPGACGRGRIFGACRILDRKQREQLRISSMEDMGEHGIRALDKGLWIRGFWQRGPAWMGRLCSGFCLCV